MIIGISNKTNCEAVLQNFHIVDIMNIFTDIAFIRFLNYHTKKKSHYQLRASVAKIEDNCNLYTGHPTILGVCQAPDGNRSPRLW